MGGRLGEGCRWWCVGGFGDRVDEGRNLFWVVF